MAQQVKVMLIDDLDGGEADQTVTFGIDGKNYEIDLSSANAGKLRDALTSFIGAARKSGTRRVGRSSRQSAGHGQPSTQEVREWAREQGMEIADRGRVPNDIYVKFQEARAS